MTRYLMPLDLLLELFDGQTRPDLLLEWYPSGRCVHLPCDVDIIDHSADSRENDG